MQAMPRTTYVTERITTIAIHQVRYGVAKSFKSSKEGINLIRHYCHYFESRSYIIGYSRFCVTASPAACGLALTYKLSAFFPFVVSR